MAHAAGIGLRTIQRIEAGGPASLQSATAIAAVLDLSIADLKVERRPTPTFDLTSLAGLASVFALFGFLYILKSGVLQVPVHPIVQEEDRIALVLTIERRQHANEHMNTKTLTTTLLINSNGSVSGDLYDLYHITLQSRTKRSGTLSLIVSLKDREFGTPLYVGSDEIRFKVGETAELDFNQGAYEYHLSFNSSLVPV